MRPKSPVITSCSATWEYRRLGCSGVALEGVDLRIINPSTLEQVPNGEEGEVTCAGPNVMIGYRNNPKANKEVFYYKDGKKFFRTGDLGRILDDKFLKITGRIKEQYKLENGKYVVPAPLEDMICRSRFVLQSFIYGDNKPHNICLVVPDMVELNTWAKGKGLIENDIPAGNQDAISELLAMDEVISLLADEISYASRNMKGFERPTRWSFVPEPFTQENQMLTPKMSLRRKGVMEAYSDKVEDVYSNNAGYLVNQ
jgi:long-chain acyl-CoA synthetase